MIRSCLIFVGILLSVLVSHIHAKEPFEVTGYGWKQRHSSDATTISHLMSAARKKFFLPPAWRNSTGFVSLNIRGLHSGVISSLRWDGVRGAMLHIPKANIHIFFAGSDKKEIFKKIENFLKGRNHPKLYAKLLKAYARYSPIDPIAGNPNSLMNQMGQADFSLGQLTPFSGSSTQFSSQPIRHRFQAGLTAGRTFCRSFDSTVLTIPLQYSYAPDFGAAFVVSAPITLIDNGGAQTIFGSVGAGVRFPVTSMWSLTPTLRVGAGDSLDLATGGCFASPGITSYLSYPVDKCMFSMTNTIAYYVSLPFHIGGVNLDYHLHNTCFKNGIACTSYDAATIGSRKLDASLSLVDTMFSGSHLFINHYDEVGVSFLLSRIDPKIFYDCFSVGLSYQFGEKGYKGYFLTAAYQF